MNPIKQLASQTAIYGMSSIVARFINFFFVPIYTRILSPGNYGLASELLAYIALLQVILTYGLETGFFRFANKDKNEANHLFSTASTWILISSLLFSVFIFSVSGSISGSMGHPSIYLKYVALILSIDCFTAIYFAKLRFDNRPWMFAIFKSVKILSEVGFNLLLFFWLPAWFTKHPDSFLLKYISPTPDYGYILLAILLSAVISLILFFPQIIRTPLRFSHQMWKKLMIYSLPLMVAGLPGIANDYVDRILFRYFSPDTSPWLDQLGIYSAVMKLAVFITLFVQMFRYAAEPFFFSSAEKDHMKQTYADVMKYFVILGLLLFLVIVFYADLFALILGKEFRSGMDVLPLVLLANILLGISFNLSMWYKLTEHTRYAIYITLIGLAVTVVIDIFFMPRFGYYAAAWSRLLSYIVMIVISYRLSLRFYPIPYNLRIIFLYFIAGIGLFAISILWQGLDLWIRLVLNTILIAIFGGFVIRMEKIKLHQVMVLMKLKK
ncbi:MAG: oligosaccharide flippase family protein [Bacteroidales bacterium]|nr:oligosaccharide flippase family protein [Bacteroidales bacterium]